MRKKISVSRPDAAEVYSASTARDSFAALDKRLGYSLQDARPDEPPHLLWYRDIQNRPVEELSDDDVTLALEQGIHLPVLIPHAIQRVLANPDAGALYEGQLLSALVAACKMLRDGDSERERVLRALVTLRPNVPPTIQASLDEAIHELQR